jgi:hypothetical protein
LGFLIVEEGLKKEKFAPLKRRRSVEVDAGDDSEGKRMGAAETIDANGGTSDGTSTAGGLEDGAGGSSSGYVGRVKRVAAAAAAVARAAAEKAVALANDANKKAVEAWKLSEKCEDMWPGGRLFYIYRAAGVYRVSRLSGRQHRRSSTRRIPWCA